MTNSAAPKPEGEGFDPRELSGRLLEALPVALFVTDASGRPRYANRAARELLGKGIDPEATPDDLAETYQAYVAGTNDPYPSARMPLVRALSGERSVVDDMEIRRPENTVRIQVSGAPLLDRDGKVQYAIAVFDDITERKRAEEARALLGAIVEGSDDAIIAKNLDGTILSWNPGAERIYGYSREEVKGRSISILVPPDRPEEVPELLKRIKAGERIEHYDTVRVRKDGRRIDISLTLSPMRDRQGAVVGASVIARDISERKRAEEAVAHALALEQEASRKLRALDEAKSTLLHAVSHDLRDPLSAVLGSAVLLEGDLKREQPKLSPDKHIELVRNIATSARKMSHLLRDLIDLDRLVLGIVEPHRRPTDVGELVRDLVEGSELIRQRRVEVQAERVIAWIDRAKVERIVDNLLGNATKHTPPGSPVWVRVRKEGEGVHIAVEDSGRGVPEEMKESIFEPFTQGQGGDGTQGMGIGLSLVSRFAELHGGRAWVEDRPGGGAAFRVFLPDAPGEG